MRKTRVPRPRRRKWQGGVQNQHLRPQIRREFKAAIGRARIDIDERVDLAPGLQRCQAGGQSGTLVSSDDNRSDRSVFAFLLRKLVGILGICSCWYHMQHVTMRSVGAVSVFAVAVKECAKLAAQLDEEQVDGGMSPMSTRLIDLYRRLPGRRQQLDVGGRFSVLRTRLLQEMGRQGARRLGVCPITDGAGATYVAANLALATARLSHLDVLLFDLALGHPSMGLQLGIPGHPDFVTYLTGGDVDPRDISTRIETDGRLSCFLPDRAIDRGSEVLQDQKARERIGQLVDESECDLAIFDLSPVLGTDEGLAALPFMDAILLVADGRSGTGREFADCQRLMADMPPLLGVVLNKAELLG